MLIKKGDIVVIKDCEKDYRKSSDEFYDNWHFKDEGLSRNQYGKIIINNVYNMTVVCEKRRPPPLSNDDPPSRFLTRKAYSCRREKRVFRNKKWSSHNMLYNWALFSMKNASHKLSRNKYYKLRNIEKERGEFRNNKFFAFVLSVKKEKHRALDMIEMYEPGAGRRYCRRGIIEKFIISKPA